MTSTRLDGLPPVVDAHHHFWRYGEHHQSWRDHRHGAIARDFLPGELAGDFAAAGVDAGVLIQSVDSEAENARLLDFAAYAPYVAAVVGWLPLQDPAAARRILAAFGGRPIVRGVRTLIGRDSSDWLSAPPTRELLRAVADRDLSWDVVPVTPEQVRQVTAVARAVPELRVVVDHLARPPVESGAWQPWADGIASLAALPNVAIKVSLGIDVLTDWPDWSPTSLLPYLRRVVSCFGSDRLLLASNWPVVVLRRSYQQAWNDLSAALAEVGLGEIELAAARGGNALRWYRFTVVNDLSRGPGGG